MKKSILITGKQGSGKTAKIKDILSSLDQSKSTIMTYDNIRSCNKTELREKYDVIAIDEIFSVEQFDYLSCVMSHFGFILIIATQLSVKEKFIGVDLSAFNVVECSVS